MRKKPLKSPLTGPIGTMDAQEGQAMEEWALRDGAGLALLVLAGALLWLRNFRRQRRRTIAGMLTGRPPCAQRTN